MRPHRSHSNSSPVEARQAGVIPFMRQGNATTFCLITTSSGRRWTIPKGIIEPRASAHETALKEAVEEAGLHGELIGGPFGSFSQEKWGLRFTVDVYLMQVARADAAWAEAGVRRRRWCDAETAIALVRNRPVADVFRRAVEWLDRTAGNPASG